jgi:hypothetical protein
MTCTYPPEGGGTELRLPSGGEAPSSCRAGGGVLRHPEPVEIQTRFSFTASLARSAWLRSMLSRFAIAAR